ncbi:13444_t:CDS:2 [Funneliformis mosseae]|uniref:13444_t:CDS:1 n=1 Tax=Funneliformis mosseae TaxID=27381 RepID=A0A9N9I379_FUNMO|nr:13444_t:CDS:2 [Funneliformis mosseae]
MSINTQSNMLYTETAYSKSLTNSKSSSNNTLQTLKEVMIQKHNQGDIDYYLFKLEFFTEIPDDNIEEIVTTEKQNIKISQTNNSTLHLKKFQSQI